MAFIWNDKVDGKDEVLAEDINSIGREVERLGKETPIQVTKLSQLQNDAGYITAEAVPTKLSQLEADSITGSVLSIGASALEMSGGSIHINKTDYGFYVDGNRIQSVGTPEDSADAANKGYVDGLIGDIDTALDSIISIQNSLIGGDA